MIWCYPALVKNLLAIRYLIMKNPDYQIVNIFVYTYHLTFVL